MVMLILNIRLIKVIESDREKIKFCEFWMSQKGFHHCNYSFCSKIFVFHMENSSCSYIGLGSVQIFKNVITVRQITQKMWCSYCTIKSIENLLLMKWDLFLNICLCYEE